MRKHFAWMIVLAALIMGMTCSALAADLPKVAADLLVLANSAYPLNEDDVPADLVKLVSRVNNEDGVNENGGVYTVSSTSIQLRQEAAQALAEMCVAAEEKGLILYVRQGYRSYKEEAERYARLEKRGTPAPKPGETDYQTGLAVTVVGKDWRTKTLTDKFADSREGKWLLKNASKYGFVIRYPKGKDKVTGWAYEPWHLRYVGVKAAKYMESNSMCLEEFCQAMEKAGAMITPKPTKEPKPTKTPKPEKNEDAVSATPAPTPVPSYGPGSVIILDEYGPDGDYEISIVFEGM